MARSRAAGRRGRARRMGSFGRNNTQIGSQTREDKPVFSPPQTEVMQPKLPDMGPGKQFSGKKTYGDSTMTDQNPGDAPPNVTLPNVTKQTTSYMQKQTSACVRAKLQSGASVRDAKAACNE